MKQYFLFIFLSLIASELIATSYDVEDLMPKQGKFRLYNDTSFVETSTLLNDNYQIIHNIELKYGINNKLFFGLTLNGFHSWDKFFQSENFIEKNNQDYSEFITTLTTSYTPKSKDYGYIFSLNVPVFYNNFFYDDSNLIKEKLNFNYFETTASFYKIISPITATIQLSYMNFLKEKYKRFENSDRIFLSSTINFAVNDDFTLFFGTRFDNLKKLKLDNVIIATEKNIITGVFGAMYEPSKNFIFQLSSSQNKANSTLNLSTTYKP